MAFAKSMRWRRGAWAHMARLPRGARITDYSSLGVVAQWLPRSTVDRVLANSSRAAGNASRAE